MIKHHEDLNQMARAEQANDENADATALARQIQTPADATALARQIQTPKTKKIRVMKRLLGA